MTLGTAVQRYLIWVENHLSRKTHRTYSERLRRLIERFGESKLTEVDEDELEIFLSQRGGLAPDTQRLTITAFEQFQKWAMSRRHINGPLCPPVRKPKGRQRRRLPTDEEQRQILELATDSFRRIFTALRLTGARPAELCNANIEDYDSIASLIILESHKTFVRTSQSRRIGVGYRLREILRVEIGDRTSGPIFRDERGDRWRVNQLSARYRRYRNKAGLSRELVLYSATRHEHGTKLTRKLGIRAAAHSMGHASIMTTMRYDHPDDRELSRYQDQVYDF